MKALSLTQPWATLVALNEKRIETRSWRIKRIPGERSLADALFNRIAIHASKKFPGDCADLCCAWPFREVLQAHGISRKHLPLGAIVATATLGDCIRFTHTNEVWRSGARYEEQFGDFTPGRFGFLLRDITPVVPPIACRGALGLWEVPESIAEALRGGMR
jgi:hypothetical protein